MPQQVSQLSGVLERFLRGLENGARLKEAADRPDRTDGDLDEFNPHFEGVIGDAGNMDNLAHGFDDGVAKSEAEAEPLAQNEWVGALDFQSEFAQIQRHPQSFQSMG